MATTFFSFRTLRYLRLLLLSFRLVSLAITFFFISYASSISYYSRFLPECHQGQHLKIILVLFQWYGALMIVTMRSMLIASNPTPV